jgi:hypothetical protein
MNMAFRAVLALGVAAFGYFGIYRPLQLRWGAIDDEVRRAMPGDEIQASPVFNATRAMTIRARPEQVWPWVAQIGYRRAGWYGYDWIDNDGIPSSDRILPEWQSLKVGDSIPIWRGNNFPVVVVEPNRYLVFESPDRRDSMAIGLCAAEPETTRLVWRIRLGGYWWSSPWIFAQLFADLSDFIAVRQAMEGIKARAEGTYRRTIFLYVELFAWLGMFLGFLVTLIALVLRREWVGSLLLAILTGSVTVVCVLVRPALFADIIGVVAVGVSVWSVTRQAEKRVPDSLHAHA